MKFNLKRLMVFLLVLIIAVGGYIMLAFSPILFYAPAERAGAAEKITLTGHRGAAGLRPENTLTSIKKALDLGVDRVEIDVHQSKDGIVIVLHDVSLDRTTDGEGLVKDMSYDDISVYSAGSFFGPKYTEERVPTLEQIMQIVDSRAVLVIEVKHGDDMYPGIEQRIVDMIHRYDAGPWTLVHSFDDAVLEKFHAIDPSIELHKLFVYKLPLLDRGVDIASGRLNLDDYGYCKEISLYYKFLTQTVIDKIHGMGKKVNVYTVNDAEEMRRLVNLGVDGLITDRPDLANEVLERE